MTLAWSLIQYFALGYTAVSLAAFAGRWFSDWADRQ